MTSSGAAAAGSWSHKMVEVARRYGFDGWFVNQETAGGDTALATAMKEFLTYLRASGLRVIWYDTMTRTGSVSWQNALTSANQQFFQEGSTRVSDGVFLNFWWNSPGLASSAALARSLSRSPYDLFAGVDVEANGYTTSVGWASVFPEGRPHVTSLGFYRPEWTFKRATGPVDFYTRDNRFWVGQNGDPDTTTTTTTRTAWKGVAHYVSGQTPITTLPFMTNFNTGHGRKFAVVGTVLSTSAYNNLSLQDVLPTWRWGGRVDRHQAHPEPGLGQPVRRRHFVADRGGDQRDQHHPAVRDPAVPGRRGQPHAGPPRTRWARPGCRPG
ncbi:mannosyl-glycoprotein endo-beta-N-acetylglucosaminidase [Kibdelosporangium phytohabitans]|uniref:Cytosolic endo-beta-N-acetylglucosaminidase TIM barrel domain-containing protein n=1 Tax=Kibdelosporangium phytohabitans TaxID=860235 RepID=A0A0N9HY87_9PSEU|nr:hypothetical protein [Kibdelosporangium phytohabitans]ALG07232.1 hypothetical protein AOZ06_10140 [Kibdelosporangium phytohabitans]MBE1471913.1 mannosyl-glycoprotein endo-beta-N-acetylglucosaminidase [Kibdelosporangium phytohabitans]